MANGIEQFAPGGIIAAVLVLREVFDFIRTRNNNKNNKKNNSKMHQQLHDLWSWHDVRDENGVPIWYMKRSLEKALLGMVAEIKVLNGLMRKDIEMRQRVD